MKQDTYIDMDNDGHEILRVTSKHRDIGRYVVRVSKQLSKAKCDDFTKTLNDMVFARDGVSDMFKVVHLGTSYYVIRKLEEGDQESFIEHGLLK